MQISVRASKFIDRHIVSEIPTHLEDLFDHDEATHTGRLAALAIMLLSTNVVVFALKVLLS